MFQKKLFEFLLRPIFSKRQVHLDIMCCTNETLSAILQGRKMTNEDKYTLKLSSFHLCD